MCFQYDRAYRDLKVCLKDELPIKHYVTRHLLFLKIWWMSTKKYHWYQRGFASVVYNFLDKMSPGVAATREQRDSLATQDKSKITLNQQISE